MVRTFWKSSSDIDGNDLDKLIRVLCSKVDHEVNSWIEDPCNGGYVLISAIPQLQVLVRGYVLYSVTVALRARD